jgi:hypothetical protein
VSAAAARARERAELWLDDLAWHKQMFRQSRFQWTGEHAVDIITWHTGGRVDYTTLAHLQMISRDQTEIRAYGTQCQLGMAEPLKQARPVVPGGWKGVADAVGLTVADCTMTLSLASRTPPDECTNADVRRVLRGLPFTNPLIQIWELKQLWRLYEAADDLLEDTLCDLLLELLPTHPADELRLATGPYAPPPATRVGWNRAERGGPGDDRRIPSQRF